MYDPEEIAQFDAYEPGDPKNEAYVDAVIDDADTRRDEPDDRPPLSPLGRALFDLASSEAAVVDAIRRQEY